MHFIKKLKLEMNQPIHNCILHKENQAVAFCKRCNLYICKDCIVHIEGKKWCKKCYEDFKKSSEQNHPRKCIYHPDSLGISYCKKCQGYLCQDCLTVINEKRYCKKCYDKHMEEMLKAQAQVKEAATLAETKTNLHPEKENTKKCPFCAEKILVDAIKCRYSGERLDDTPDKDKLASAKLFAAGHKKCPTCAQITLNENIECPSCNKLYTQENGKDCPNCNHRTLLDTERCVCCHYLFVKGTSISKYHSQEKLPKPSGPVCPRCGSYGITAQKHGYGAIKGAAGLLIAGPVGLLSGFWGSRKVDIICIKCGHRWKR